MSQHLFLFTIGPVQSFIAQARKTQDLYAGSGLLSDLIEKAIENLPQNVTEVIFPNKNIPSKPNRFIAVIETDNPEQLAKSVEKCVREKFKSIADGLYNKYENNGKKPKNFEKQIDNFLDIYWVALPYNESNYADTYKELERYIGAIKNTRDFQQLKETGRKCSICGERNVLFYRLTDKEKEKGGLKERQDGLLKKIYVRREEVIFYKPKDEREELQIQKGEGLCAVCFTKRFYKVSRFSSTAEIALMDWLDNIPEDAKHAYKGLFNNFDEQLYYEENLRREYLEKYNHFKDVKDENSLLNAKGILKGLYNKYGKPHKYYALIMSDGDNMGKWLSGEFLEDKTKLKKLHEELSKKLGEYAKNVENIIGKLKGKLVYAGGDDAMAFVNLEHLFDVLSDLRQKFPKFEEMKNDSNEKIVEEGVVSTASAGVVIAHYKTPLSEVLKWARNMEHEAKENGGRDAFVIAVLKHSGEINKTILKWEFNGCKPIEIMKDIYQKIQSDEFSNTFIKNLNTEFLKLMDKEGKWNEKQAIKTEIKRLTLKSCQQKKDETKKDFKSRKDIVNAYFIPKLNSLFNESKNLNNFLSFLNIADFLARRQNDY